MKNTWRMPHPATMFLLLTMAVVFLSWICDIYGLKVTLPQTGEDIRVQSLLSPEGIRWWLRNAIKNFTGFAPLGMVIIAMFGLGVAQHSGFIDACIRMGVGNRQEERKIILWVMCLACCRMPLVMVDISFYCLLLLCCFNGWGFIRLQGL